MITESIMHFLTMILKPILNLIPAMETFLIPENIMSYLTTIFRTIGIFIPVSSLLPLLVFSMAFTCWRFGYAIIVRIRNMF